MTVDAKQLLEGVSSPPWFAPPPSTVVGLGIVGPNGRHIADVSHCRFGLESDEEDQANARLIAAAPQLAERVVELEEALAKIKPLALSGDFSPDDIGGDVGTITLRNPDGLEINAIIEAALSSNGGGE